MGSKIQYAREGRQPCLEKESDHEPPQENIGGEHKTLTKYLVNRARRIKIYKKSQVNRARGMELRRALMKCIK